MGSILFVLGVMVGVYVYILIGACFDMYLESFGIGRAIVLTLWPILLLFFLLILPFDYVDTLIEKKKRQKKNNKTRR